MRLSRYFFHTLKEAPQDTEIISHQLLERGGYLKRLGKGLYIYTPLMWRVLKKLQNIIREEMDRTGALELTMPLLHPAELWKKTGRWDDFTSTNLLYTLKDRQGHDYCLAPTHEEVVVSLASNWITSHKQMPVNLYQIGTKFRDEIRPRFGLMRGKEFLMKDGYSFSATPEQMEEIYEQMSAAYKRIFERCSLDFVKVVAHGGKIGKGKSEEFQVKADIGEDVVLVCQDFACNVETAQAIASPFNYESDLKPKSQIATPGVTDIASLSQFTKEPPAKILKTLIYKLTFADRTDWVAIGIRGDRQINEVKVESYFNAIEVHLASDEEVEKVTGASPGFVGPINLKLPFYADLTAQPMTNFVVAANKNGTHFINVNYHRDIPSPLFADFLLAEAGDKCPYREGHYVAQRGIEVGHIFNLGTLYSEKMGALFQDEKGQAHPYWMGCYGIGVGRTAAACVEQKHDEKGIIWPMSLTPFKILITASATNDPILVNKAESIYRELQDLDAEPLLDDRNERLGLKLKDADLIGLPYKLIVGKQFKENGLLEIEARGGQKELIEQAKFLAWVEKNLQIASSQ